MTDRRRVVIIGLVIAVVLLLFFGGGLLGRHNSHRTASAAHTGAPSPAATTRAGATAPAPTPKAAQAKPAPATPSTTTAPAAPPAAPVISMTPAQIQALKLQVHLFELSYFQISPDDTRVTKAAGFQLYITPECTTCVPLVFDPTTVHGQQAINDQLFISLLPPAGNDIVLKLGNPDHAVVAATIYRLETTHPNTSAQTVFRDPPLTVNLTLDFSSGLWKISALSYS